MQEKLMSEKQIRNKTLLAFTAFVVFLAGAIFLWKYIRSEQKDGDIPVTLRKGLHVNERLFSSAFNGNRLVPTYPVSQAVRNVRVNGDVGLKDPAFDTANWK